jgi:hypothetical protein
MEVQIQVVEQHMLLRAAFTVERLKAPDGSQLYAFHFDVLKGNIAERTTVQFDEAGLETVVSAIDGARHGIEVARALPRGGNGSAA